MSQDVQDFYNRNAKREWDRLDLPFGRLEFASTLHLLDKYFPSRGRVCDIGGGPGRYTVELARRGYRVTLVDLSDQEVQLARMQLESAGLSADQTMVGDPRRLDRLPAEWFDAALLMGPMYHLVEAEERAAALRELIRVLRQGGVAIVSYLNSWGILRTGLVDFPHWYDDIAVVQSMQDEHVFSAQKLKDFTECYWSTPPAAKEELEQSGLQVVSYAGAEGFAGGMKPLIERLAVEHPDAYRNVVTVAAELSELPQYRDCTDHLHFVVRKG